MSPTPFPLFFATEKEHESQIQLVMSEVMKIISKQNPHLLVFVGKRIENKEMYEEHIRKAKQGIFCVFKTVNDEKEKEDMFFTFLTSAHKNQIQSDKQSSIPIFMLLTKWNQYFETNPRLPERPAL